MARNAARFLAIALGTLCCFAASRTRACGWEWETFAAEATRLPCVHDAIIGAFAKHTPEYYERTLAATELALAWAPHYTEALDARGMAFLHLGRLKEAEAIMKRRLEAAPDAYPGHANLGTLYTFSGEYDAALEHIDKALAVDPEAHFGREKYHRQLVVFLQRRKDDEAKEPSNFLGVALTDGQRFFGAPQKFEAAGLKPDVFDALSAMIAVYGADRLPDIYFTLGDALALRGEKKLAWAAYQRSIDLGHPAAKAIRRYTARLLEIVSKAGAQPREPARTDGFQRPGGLRALPTYYATVRMQANGSRSDYERWERAQLQKGLRPWSQADLARVYKRMDQLWERCKTPNILDSTRQAAPDASRAPTRAAP